jgi:hypothetical protein
VTKEFTLRYSVDPAVRKPTVIFVPVARHYGGAYNVTIDGPARVRSQANAPLLQVRNFGLPGVVTVTVRPVGP